MSLVKRLVMRPTGVMSNQRGGALTTERSSRLKMVLGMDVSSTAHRTARDARQGKAHLIALNDRAYSASMANRKMRTEARPAAKSQRASLRCRTKPRETH